MPACHNLFATLREIINADLIIAELIFANRCKGDFAEFFLLYIPMFVTFK